MLRWFLLTMVLTAAAPVAASEESEKQALSAAGFYAALAFQCDDLVDEDLKSLARRDAVLTLEAGGYSPEAASAKATELFTALEATWAPTSEMPKTMCQAMSRSIVEGREALREELRSKR